MNEQDSKNSNQKSNGEAPSREAITHQQETNSDNRKPEEDSANNKLKPIWDSITEIPIDRKIELILAFLVTVATIVYVIVAGKTLSQIKAGSSDTHDLAVQAKNQADTMAILAKAQIFTARNSSGVAPVSLHYIAFWREGDKLFATIVVHNVSSNRETSSIQVAATMGFSNSLPTRYDSSQFEFMSPSTLPRYNPRLPIYEPNLPGDTNRIATFRVSMGENISSPTDTLKPLYVHGRIRSKDVMGEWMPDADGFPFCRVLTAKEIIDSGDGETHGTRGRDCREK